MLEKLPMNYVRKLYDILTVGNEDVNFCCLCLHNRNREAAINNPIGFGINLIKLNILCRIPGIRKIVLSGKIGKTYLSSIYVRPTITELASGLLDNKAVMTDVFGCAIDSLKSDSEIYSIIEEKTGVRSFAKLRSKYDDKFEKIENIYRRINDALGASVDYHIELELRRKFYVPNRYVVRLLDIAAFNNLKIYTSITSSLPKDYIISVMNDFGIHSDVLNVSNEIGFEYLSPGKASSTAVLSSDYSFIKRYMRLGCKVIYYRKPEAVMEKVFHPKLSKEFRKAYDTVCGNRLFSGIHRYSEEYELAYMCLAPYIHSRQSAENNSTEQLDILSCKKILAAAPEEVRTAVEDFCDDYDNYSRQSGETPQTAYNDAIALYKLGESNMVKLFC